MGDAIISTLVVFGNNTGANGSARLATGKRGGNVAYETEVVSVLDLPNTNQNKSCTTDQKAEIIISILPF
jgi:hypothetical protein